LADILAKKPHLVKTPLTFLFHAQRICHQHIRDLGRVGRRYRAANLLHPRNKIQSTMNSPAPAACALTIAGSDSGASAGIQADLKTFAAHGIHGLTAITAVTAQNTHQITAVRVLSRQIVLAQLDAVLADFHIAAVKIGMLGSVTNARAVAHWLRDHRLPNVVVDPVLAASSGSRLLAAGALSTLRRELLPLARVLTPNVPEAEALLGRPIRNVAEMRAAAHDLRALGPHAVLIKGGHLDGAPLRDYFVDDEGELEFRHRRRNYAVRGTGCSLASAIAAGLAQGLPLRVAVEHAERYLQSAFASARRYGRGPLRTLQHDASRGHD
jgi:hydroxymethylpyrimidine/phosphomethylpyrimidine kinase